MRKYVLMRIIFIVKTNVGHRCLAALFVDILFCAGVIRHVVSGVIHFGEYKFRRDEQPLTWSEIKIAVEIKLVTHDRAIGRIPGNGATECRPKTTTYRLDRACIHIDGSPTDSLMKML